MVLTTSLIRSAVNNTADRFSHVIIEKPVSFRYNQHQKDNPCDNNNNSVGILSKEGKKGKPLSGDKEAAFMQNTQLIENTEIMGIVETILSTVPALEIYVFGSYANGTAKEDSDYDFYVVIPDGGMRDIEASCLIQSAIKTRTRGIDMLVGTKSKFDKYKDTISFIEGEVARTGVKLHG